MKTVFGPSITSTPVLPQMLPQSVLAFSRSLRNLTFPAIIPLPGVIDPPQPLRG
jgi:hypothetical protein